MINKKIRDELAECAPEAILFDNPSFDNSIIGLTTDGGVIYDMERMVDELSKDDNMSQEEALDFICYNTLRAIPYAGNGDGVKPVVMDCDAFTISRKDELYYEDQAESDT